MEQNIGILLCVCTCLLCVIEIFLFGYSIYKKSIVGIIIHILGIGVSALISVFLIAYMQNKILSFETNKIIFATVIAGFVFAVAVSIKSLFRDAEPTINERIKQKRKKLKEITEEKENANIKKEEAVMDSEEEGDTLKESNKSLDKSKDNEVSNDKKENEEEASKKDNEYNNSYDESDKMTMVKRSQKGRRNKKKSSSRKLE